ncbi:Phytochrome-like protein cph2 [Paraburkholderia aspalathi]|uniref:EAL domain-containing protein n=1 Tax=Paraburkholderia aspalathi TaxID=1324617 RepID=UPI001B131974|nr:EAL domain-containing protein [Paraburkholderia aspalathi]CAE6866985.1 Phytochrome-like protein cph2 [Paraburkholderia aspalathi]
MLTSFPRPSVDSGTALGWPFPALADIEYAFNHKQIVAYFQAQHCISSGKLTGAEVLVRWNHPELGILRPDRFLDVICKYGLEGRLFECMIEHAIAMQRTVGKHRALNMAVNVHASVASSAEWADRVAKRVEQANVAPACVTIEVTEHGSSEKDVALAGAVTHLRRSGLQCAIDDYGTGASTLERLAMVPFNILKLDRHLIARARTDDYARSALTDTVVLAHECGMTVVAEGIETARDLQCTRKARCDVAQGFYFSQPVSASGFLRYCQTN